MKTAKKFLAAALCLIMLAGTVAVSVNASVVSSGSCGADGDNLTWNLEDSGILTICGIGAMEDYELIPTGSGGYIPNVPWWSFRESINKVIIKDGVTSIGTRAFESCCNMTSITIPESVTGIGADSLSYCDKLTDVKLSDNVTSIGKSAFYGCDNLENVNIPDSVTVINDGVFRDCASLTNIVIPESITSLGDQAFFGCSELKSITIPDSVTSIGDMAFAYCSNLKNITIPDSVTEFGSWMFENCDNLESVVIGAGITRLEWNIFAECPNLASVSVSEKNDTYDSRNNCNAVIETATNSLEIGCKGTKIPEGVTSIASGAFIYCKTLTNIVVPEGVTLIYPYAFSDCESLESIYLPASLEAVGYEAFYTAKEEQVGIAGCKSLTDVYYGGSKSDREKLIIEDENDALANATWHYNCIMTTGIITGNPIGGNKSYGYKSTVTFNADVPDGGSVEWYIDGQLVGTGSSYTTPQMKNSYTVKAVVTAADGTQTIDTEIVTIKAGLFDKIIAFFKLLFNKNAYTYIQQ